MENVLFVGLDVDDKSFSICAVDTVGREQFNFLCKPNVGALVKKLKQAAPEFGRLRICYEATYLGFSLCRQLLERDLKVEVIAPSLIPTLPGDKVKTNRLDSRKLAEFYRAGLLTVVHVPTYEEETVRDLIRGRHFLVAQTRALKQYILAVCRRAGWDFKQSQRAKSYWTGAHMDWLAKQVKESRSQALRFNLGSYLDHLATCDRQIESFNAEIAKFSKLTEYKQKVEALKCFRGVEVLTAMTMITEIGDVKRFSHPKKLTSYAGMDLREYSSSKQARFGITKMGNSYLRTSAIEACQSIWQPPRRSRRLREHMKTADPKFIAIADRCQKRLHTKSSRLLYSGKQKNKIKVACARELLSFVWEALRAA